MSSNFNNGIVSGKRHLSQNQLTVNAKRAASALHSVGIWQGDVVALLLRNDFCYFEATQGATLLGATTVPLNWHMTPEEIAYILDDCDAKVIIAHSDLLTEAVLTICSERELIAVETPPEIVTAYSIPRKQYSIPGGLPEWDDWIQSFEQWRKPSANMSQPMFYTSGTTGMPKGVLRKAVCPVVAAKAIQRTGLAFGLSGQPVRSIMTGPLYHSAPNAYGMKVVRDGGLLVLQPRFDTEQLLKMISRYQITHLHMVPTMFVRLLKLDKALREESDVSSLIHVAHGAAPCPVDVKKSMIAWWGNVIHEYYAMTETGIIAICNSKQWMSHQGTVGTAVSGVEIRTVDENGNDCEAGVAGEIWISSETTPYVTYHRASAKTEEMRKGNFIATGDVGYLDKDGFLYISDRISDMVISGGVNIYPAEIESVLFNIPGIKDCAVFGVPDKEFGERLISVVETSKNIEAEHIKAYLKEHISSYKIPREVIFSKNLPREDSGKIKKRILKEAFSNGELQ